MTILYIHNPTQYPTLTTILTINKQQISILLRQMSEFMVC